MRNRYYDTNDIEFQKEPEGVDYAPPMAVYLASRAVYIGGAVTLPFMAGGSYGFLGYALGGVGALAMLGVGFKRFISEEEGFENTEKFAAANKKRREHMIVNNGGPIAFSALSLNARAGAQMMTWMNTLSGGRLTHKVRKAEKLVVELEKKGGDAVEKEETYWLTTHTNKGVSDPTPLSRQEFIEMKKEIDKTNVPLQLLKKVNDPTLNIEVIVEKTTVRGQMDSRALKAPALRVIQASPEIQSHADLPDPLAGSPKVLAEAWFSPDTGRQFSRGIHERMQASSALIRRYSADPAHPDRPNTAVPLYPAEFALASDSHFQQQRRFTDSFVHPEGHDDLPKDMREAIKFAQRVTFQTLVDDESGSLVLVSVGERDVDKPMPCRLLTGNDANTWYAALKETDYEVDVDGTVTLRGEPIEEFENETENEPDIM